MGGNGIAAAAVLAAALLAPGCSRGSSWEDDDCGEWEEEYDGCDDDGGLLGAVVVAILVGDDDDDEGGDPDPPPVRRRRFDLLRDRSSPDPDGRGLVEVRTSRRREGLRIVAARLAPYTAVEFLVEDSAGIAIPLGTRIADPAGRAGLGLVTDGWDALPGGSPSLGDLGGRGVEVRDGAGRTLLRGRVPFRRVPPGARRARSDDLDPATGIGARINLRVHLRRGRQRFDLRLTGLAPGAEAAVLVEDGTGTPVEALRGAADARGTLRFRADSRAGDPLPLGLLDLPALGGRAYEVRSGGEALLRGDFPSF